MPVAEGPLRTARLLSGALRACQFYPTGHDRILAALDRLTTVSREQFATGGPFEISLEGGHIAQDPDGKDSLALGVLSGEMQRRGIRALRFKAPPTKTELEKLVTLLGEPPLELTGRGGVAAVAGSFETLALIPYRYEVRSDESHEPIEAEDESWDLGNLRAGTTATGMLSVEDIADIPGVVEEMGALRNSLGPDADVSETEGIVSGMLQIALGRLAGPEGAGSGALPPASDRAPKTSEVAEELGPLHATADRIYGIVLAHLTADNQFGANEWTPSEADPGLRPVDPKRLLHTKTLLDTRLTLPPDLTEDALGFDQTPDVSEVAVGLLTGDGDRAARDAYLIRLRDSIAALEDRPEREDALGRLVGLLYSVDLTTLSLVEVLGTLKRGSSAGELARALLARMPTFAGARVRSVAERIDAETIERVIDRYLRGGSETRTAALTFLRATAERVIAALSSGVQNPDSTHRRMIVDLARELDGRGVPRLLEKLAHDPDQHVCLAALKALARRPDEDSLVLFEKALLGSPSRIWRPLAQTATGPGGLRIPRILDAIVRGEDDGKRPLRERLEALRALDRVRGTAGRERVVQLARFFSLREPAACVMIRREARRQLQTSPSSGSPGAQP